MSAPTPERVQARASGLPRAQKRARLVALVALGPLALLFACGETRRPIGDECIRDEDCLSSVCAARLCASAPSLVSGANNPPPPEEPRIPEDGGSSPADVATGA